MKLITIDSSDVEKSWNEIRASCPYLSEWGLERLKAGLKNDVSYVLIETDYLCKDHRNLHSNFYSKKFVPKSPKCSRLHFFSGHTPSLQDFITPANREALNKDYLGYSVIRPVEQRSLGRTIIDPGKLKRLANSTTFYLSTPFKTHLYGFLYTVKGYPYTSQDTDATVCAHSALWGLCRYLSEKHSEYGELYPYDLIEMTGKSGGRSVPYRGMTYSDYAEILSQFGTHPVIIRAKKAPEHDQVEPKQFRDICTYVESGFPVLASFSGHVVSLIGHTIDYSRRPKLDKEGFVDSSSFLKEFVVVDDNYFPYQLLGYKGNPDNYGQGYYKKEDPASKEYSIDSIYAAVCPLPEKAFMPAEVATEKATNALKYLINGHNPSKLSAPFVTRIFLTSSSSYKRRKLEIVTRETGSADLISTLLSSIELPHFVWIMELYTLDEYPKGICCGEVLLDATSGKKEDGRLYLRLVNIAYIGNKKVDLDSDRFRQYTHNLGDRD